MFTDPQATDRYKPIVNKPKNPEENSKNSEGSAHTSGCHNGAYKKITVFGLPENA